MRFELSEGVEHHSDDAPDQAARRTPRRRPARPQWRLLGIAIGCSLGGTFQSSMVLAPLATIASFAGGGPAAVGRFRGGLTSKLHVIVDRNGLPLRLGITSGQAHDNRDCSTLLSGLAPRTMLLADRGYDAGWIRTLVNRQGA